MIKSVNRSNHSRVKQLQRIRENKMNELLLGVNVDHIATLRQARGTNFPDPVYAV